MSPNGSIKPIVKKRLDQIMKQSQCHLNVLDPSSTKVPGPSSSRDTTDIMEIEITGVLEAVERARIETLVLLDELVGSLLYTLVRACC